MKKVNDIDFGANMFADMCMKVNVAFIFIDTKPRIIYKYIYLHHLYA